MKLNIYEKKEGKNIIVKTYEAETYDLMFGTVEDFMNLVDVKNIDLTASNEQVYNSFIKLIVNGFEQITPLMLDIFDGLTTEELRKAKVREIANVVIEALKYSIAISSNKGKNA